MNNDPTSGTDHKMLPVWFFIGAILAIYGVMIVIEGLYELNHPPGTELENLHAPIWWGAVMTIVGVAFIYKLSSRRDD